jgi:hypothetical protein
VKANHSIIALALIAGLGALLAQQANLANLSNITGGSFTVNGALTAGASSAIGWSGRSQLTSTADGFVNITNAAGTGLTSLILGPAGGDPKSISLQLVYQVNPSLFLRDAGGGATANLFIEAQKATTGVRYVCINTSGQLVSQQAACSGT